MMSTRKRKTTIDQPIEGKKAPGIAASQFHANTEEKKAKVWKFEGVKNEPFVL